MYILNNNQIKEYNLRKAKRFVEFWQEKYSYTPVRVYGSKNKYINYIEELNINHKLTNDNIKRLLRWKDKRWLTEKSISGPNKGKENKKVKKVIENRIYLNKFRIGKMHHQEFNKKTNELFPNGLIWQAFLFHIARPFDYPIADQNVFRSYKEHQNVDNPTDWEGYLDYKNYFFKISFVANVIIKKPKGNEKNIEEIVTNLRKVDKALFAFGQFLNRYG